MPRTWSFPLAIGLLACGLACDDQATSRAAASADVPSARRELTVYAAASLREALVEVAADYERVNHAEIVFNFGSSGTLARQILAAGQADLFISADEVEMERLAKANLIEESTRRVILSNQLVVIEPVDADRPGASLFTQPFTVADLANPVIRRLSLANTATVPAGRYARAWLETAGAWTRVEERVLPAVDVRAALAAVESGAAQAGIVYRTDASLSKKVRIVHAVPSAEAPRIEYPLAVVRNRPHDAQARRFATWLHAPAATRVFEHFGFIASEAPAPTETSK